MEPAIHNPAQKMRRQVCLVQCAIFAKFLGLEQITVSDGESFARQVKLE